jgi:hypothetical protein
MDRLCKIKVGASKKRVAGNEVIQARALFAHPPRFISEHFLTAFNFIPPQQVDHGKELA